MWVKVLPADMAKEPYFTEVDDDPSKATRYIRDRIIHGYVELVKTQTLINAFGFSLETGQPHVVMLIDEDGQLTKKPVNARASKYYPNDYGIMIRGTAVLTGYSFYVPKDDPTDIGFDIATMPAKWKVIYDMETAASEAGDDYEKAHSQLDDLLLSVADPDVRKAYEEVRDSYKNWPTA